MSNLKDTHGQSSATVRTSFAPCTKIILPGFVYIKKQNTPLSDKAQTLSFCRSRIRPLKRKTIRCRVLWFVVLLKLQFCLTHTHSIHTISFEHSSAANASASFLSESHETTDPGCQDRLTACVISLWNNKAKNGTVKEILFYHSLQFYLNVMR